MKKIIPFALALTFYCAVYGQDKTQAKPEGHQDVNIYYNQPFTFNTPIVAKEGVTYVININYTLSKSIEGCVAGDGWSITDQYLMINKTGSDDEAKPVGYKQQDLTAVTKWDPEIYVPFGSVFTTLWKAPDNGTYKISFFLNTKCNHKGDEKEQVTHFDLIELAVNNAEPATKPKKDYVQTVKTAEAKFNRANFVYDSLHAVSINAYSWSLMANSNAQTAQLNAFRTGTDADKKAAAKKKNDAVIASRVADDKALEATAAKHLVSVAQDELNQAMQEEQYAEVDKALDAAQKALNAQAAAEKAQQAAEGKAAALDAAVQAAKAAQAAAEKAQQAAEGKAAALDAAVQAAKAAQAAAEKAQQAAEKKAGELDEAVKKAQDAAEKAGKAAEKVNKKTDKSTPNAGEPIKQ